ncbi:3-hydroxyacyl-CoA dehydrogenase [Hymenobacter jeollabukensis]|uniref:3-hydroxyacyl-CoA dehydrogenase n=1 Tax=Hymenobacter jeollabukensis TaxID=2025313 RepID=A0A5R8WUL5_9BACT|nr:3-hydroxyacyl-CoA dehydrogenase [Hymenobacter jeollabukensis]TLM95146.1 3-hydroxyacyl-CoA dehydrogenase [Hymenobacter jeollabukensis]
MHLLILDGAHLEAEFRWKFGSAHQYSFVPATAGRLVDEIEEAMPLLDDALPTADVVFDFGNYGPLYEEKEGIVVFLEAATESLAGRFGSAAPAYPVFGFCGLPTLLNHPLLEVSLYHDADADQLTDICARLDTAHCLVADRVGLFTPRLLALSVNEVCFALQEGLVGSSVAGMALESVFGNLLAQANAVGVGRIHEVLSALWDDTHDPRYQVCPLLKRMALRGESFDV